MQRHIQDFHAGSARKFEAISVSDQEPMTLIRCIVTHSLTHGCYAGWHVGQQQSYPTPVCSRPVSECSPRCNGGGSLLQFDARYPWIALVPASPLVSHVKGCAGNVAWLSSHHMSDPSPMVPMLFWLQWARRCWLVMVSVLNVRRIL